GLEAIERTCVLNPARAGRVGPALPVKLECFHTYVPVPCRIVNGGSHFSGLLTPSTTSGLERDCDNSECRFGIKAKKAKNLMRIYGRTCSKRSTGVSMIQRILLEFIETCIGGQEVVLLSIMWNVGGSEPAASCPVTE